MPNRSSEGIFKRLNCLLQSIATFSIILTFEDHIGIGSEGFVGTLCSAADPDRA